LSVHYSFRPKNWQLFGEVARSQNGALAQLHSLLVGLGPKLDLALSYRHYAKAYQAMFADAFRSSTRTQNETGWYMGIQLRPHRQWTLNAYIDIWQHPWLQFRADRPSLGRAYRLRLNYKRKRQSETYIELRDRIRLENVPNEEEQTNYLVPLRSFQIRWHHNHWVHARLELRSRIDMGFSDSPVHHYQRGFSAFQDVLYRPLGFPLSFTCRFAIFDTGSYQTRYYNYENNLLNSFSIPAYYNRGTRWYFNIRYKATKNWTMEMRVGQTDWINPEDRLDQENKREMSVQLRYQVDTRKRR
ncbi:MAG: helix-hairpin-helix domain-containing protein, partial [Bacteroidota bacterium]